MDYFSLMQSPTSKTVRVVLVLLVCFAAYQYFEIRALRADVDLLSRVTTPVDLEKNTPLFNFPASDFVGRVVSIQTDGTLVLHVEMPQDFSKADPELVRKGTFDPTDLPPYKKDVVVTVTSETRVAGTVSATTTLAQIAVGDTLSVRPDKSIFEGTRFVAKSIRVSGK